MRWAFAILGSLLLSACLAAQPQSAATSSASSAVAGSHELDVSGNQVWTDSGVDVAAGESLAISAAGSLQFADGSSAGPQGAARGWKDLLRSLPVNSAGRGALVGRIGSDDAAVPFLVGAQLNLKVRVSGRLFLGFNGSSSDSPQGSFHVSIEISGGAASVPGAASGST